MHFVCETVLQQEKPGTINEAELFLQKFREEISLLPKKVRDKIKDKDIKDMEEQGKTLAPLAIPALRKQFPGFILVGVEEYLYEPIEEYDLNEYSFKGYVDLIIKTPNGKYYVIDWKTCSWGWDAKKRSDPMVTYQLTLYKHFLSKKLGIDPKDVETYFALLKRTASKDRVEIFRVTSGPRKTRNALKLLEECVYNVDHNRHIKNRLSCGSCDYHRTEYCP